MFWFLALCLAVIAGLFVALSARGRGDAASREDGALAVYRDQLAEVERDAARGLIGPAEAEAATVEVQRRMLRASREGAGASGRTRRWPVLAAALLVPLGGIALYAVTGTPGAQSVTLAERAEERAAAGQASARVRALLPRVRDAGEAANPNDRLALASDLALLGREREAAEVLAPAIARDDAPSGAITYFVELSLAATGGAMTPELRELVTRAVRTDPLNPAASFYLAYALESEGDPAAAREVLVRRLSIEPAPTPWMPSFLAGIDRLGAALGLGPADPQSILGSAPTGLLRRGPDAAAVADAEAMDPEAREAMIRGMVDGLAARLEETPGDAEGWLQLARARAVLGDADAARDALGRAQALSDAAPGDAALAQAVADLRAALGL